MSKRIGNNISIDEEEGKSSITILDRLEGWMKMALLGWIVVWSSLGLYVISYMFRVDLPKESFLFFIVYLVFWAWFAFKSIYAYLFKSYGFEWIVIDRKTGYISYGRSLLGMANTKSQFSPDEVSKVVKVEPVERSFGSVYSKSFWIVGNEQLQLQGGSKNQLFGMHLSAKDANNLLGELNRKIKRFKQS